MKHESDGDTNFNRRTQYSNQRIVKVAGRIGNKNTSRDYPNNSTVKIGQNTKKSPGDLRRFAVTQTPVKGNQLMLV